MTAFFPIDPASPLPEQLKKLRSGAGVTILELADKTGLSRLTTSAAEGRTDARLSTMVSLFDALGYQLLAVPKSMAAEVAAFVNNGGRTLSLPAGTVAPRSIGQKAFIDFIPQSETLADSGALAGQAPPAKPSKDR